MPTVKNRNKEVREAVKAALYQRGLDYRHAAELLNLQYSSVKDFISIGNFSPQRAKQWSEILDIPVEVFTEGLRVDGLVPYDKCQLCKIIQNNKRTPKGIVYILSKPSNPYYVKIGYTRNLKKRIGQLNGSETVDSGFQAYATYEVNHACADKQVHQLIDKLNPSLRVKEKIDGKTRVTEFFRMSKEDAYDFLVLLAKASDTMDRLRKVNPEEYES